MSQESDGYTRYRDEFEFAAPPTPEFSSTSIGPSAAASASLAGAAKDAPRSRRSMAEPVQQQQQHVVTMEELRDMVYSNGKHKLAAGDAVQMHWTDSRTFRMLVYASVFLFTVMASCLVALDYGLLAESSSLQQTKLQAIHMMKRANDSGIVDELFVASTKWKAANRTDLALAAFDTGLKLLDNTTISAQQAQDLLVLFEAKLNNANTDEAIRLFNNYIALGSSYHSEGREMLLEWQKVQEGDSYRLLKAYLQAKADSLIAGGGGGG